MSWLSTLTDRFVPALAVVFAVLLAPPLIPSAAGAVEHLESALMPGEVIRGHAELEATCDKCHVRFDRAAQPGLCLDCHKAVAQDVRQHRGYHGRLKEIDCRSCHTDHKGRGARVIRLDEAGFDHAQTDFALRGKHRGMKCTNCHRPGTKHRAAPPDCNGCHRKDDRHKGGLGPKCENCHSETGWKETRFDHDKTHFPLRRSHTVVPCAKCHVDQRFVGTPRECASCHRKDDAHKGLFGARCETCHTEAKWSATTFRHERFVLLDKHRTVKCQSCHRVSPYREKTSTRCVSCHRSDDIHKGALGDKCDHCHSEKAWKNVRFDHDRDTQFKLREKHRAAKCVACHKGQEGVGFRDKLATTCVSCHDKDDREKGHKGRFGAKCETCHTEKGFRDTIFDHGRDTAFALTGRHVKVKCGDCHREALYGDKAKLDTNCLSCHKGDDVHFRSFGTKCDECHVTENWRKVTKRELTPANDKAPLPPGKGP